MTAVLSWILVVACLLMLALFWDLALHLAGRFIATEWNAGASEKTFIFVKLQVCLPAYPEYLAYCYIRIFVLLIKTYTQNIINNSKNIWHTTK